MFTKERVVLAEGGVRDTLSYNQLSQASIRVASLNEQTKIGSLFKELDNTITLHQRKLEKLEELKKFLLSKMFI